MGSENRKRDKPVLIRLSTSEYEKIQAKADRAQISVPAFLRELALKQEVKAPLVDREGALEIAKQLKAIGNNVNQIAYALNRGAVVSADLSATKEELLKIWQRLNSEARNQPTD